jgi:hypothetical protein
VNPTGDNPDLLNQDCSQPLFRWFLSRIDWRRTLVELCREKTERKHSMNLENQEIQILVRDVYGKRKFYPLCDKAKVFASIAGTTTLTEETLAKIDDLGYTIMVVHQQIKIQDIVK